MITKKRPKGGRLENPGRFVILAVHLLNPTDCKQNMPGLCISPRGTYCPADKTTTSLKYSIRRMYLYPPTES